MHWKELCKGLYSDLKRPTMKKATMKKANHSPDFVMGSQMPPWAMDEGKKLEQTNQTRLIFCMFHQKESKLKIIFSNETTKQAKSS